MYRTAIHGDIYDKSFKNFSNKHRQRNKPGFPTNVRFLIGRDFHPIRIKRKTYISHDVGSKEKPVNEEKPKSGSDGGSQEGNSDESSDESNLDSESSEYRSDLEEMLKNGVLKDESDSGNTDGDGPESSNNLPSAVGVISSQFEREWLNKSKNWEKFMNEKNGPRAKLFKKYGDYKGK